MDELLRSVGHFIVTVFTILIVSLVIWLATKDIIDRRRKKSDAKRIKQRDQL